MESSPQQTVMWAEVYAVLNQLVGAYQEVMETFSTIAAEVGEIKFEMQQLREFVNQQYTDTVQARDLWHTSAVFHREDAERLKKQLEELLGQDSDHIVVKLPLPAVKIEVGKKKEVIDE